MSAIGERSTECFVCRKHQGEISVPGGAIYEDDLIYAGHASIPEGQTTAYLGSLLVEPKRHAPGLEDLTDIEAQRVGVFITRLSRALKASEGAEHIYLFVLGHAAVLHLHIWVVPRYPGTPREYLGMRVDEWEEAPRGGPQEIADLCERIRIHLASESD
jgi:diadenosine tetraphosphate (Ap4A) HIT family hydrolase